MARTCAEKALVGPLLRFDHCKQEGARRATFIKRENRGRAMLRKREMNVKQPFLFLGKKRGFTLLMNKENLTEGRMEKKILHTLGYRLNTSEWHHAQEKHANEGKGIPVLL